MYKWEHSSYWNQNLRLALLFRKGAQRISKLMPHTPVTLYLYKQKRHRPLIFCHILKLRTFWHWQITIIISLWSRFLPNPLVLHNISNICPFFFISRDTIPIWVWFISHLKKYYNPSFLSPCLFIFPTFITWRNSAKSILSGSNYVMFLKSFTQA